VSVCPSVPGSRSLRLSRDLCTKLAFFWLYCRRRLAKLLCGALHISDRTDGVRGTRFSLYLPLGTGPGAVTAPVVVDAVVELAPAPPPAPAAAVSALGSRAPTRGSLVSPSHARARVTLRKTVLVVDDSEGNRRLLRRMLEQLGCAVVEAADGDEVISAITSAQAFDVVLMDIEMPRMDGVAALGELRRGGWSTPVVAVTGNSDSGRVAHCLCAAARSAACNARAHIMFRW
jgi:CheY-like chemotaxis protein